MNAPKTMYWITEEQLMNLQVLAWGAKMLKPEDPKAFADTVEQVRTQLVNEVTGYDVKAK